MTSRTEAIMLKALDGLEARSIATSQNIANAGTPNYRPLRVRFEESLKAAANGQERLASFSPSIVRPAQGLADGAMRLDLELSNASETATRYAALVTVLDRSLSLEALAYRSNQ